MTKTTNINDMATGQIIWHLVLRHRVVLLIASNLLTLTYFVVTRLPASIQAFTK